MIGDRLELVPDDVSPRELQAESAQRARRAGFDVTSTGGRPPAKIQTVCNFGARKLNIWPRDAAGRLIE